MHHWTQNWTLLPTHAFVSHSEENAKSSEYALPVLLALTALNAFTKLRDGIDKRIPHDLFRSIGNAKFDVFPTIENIKILGKTVKEYTNLITRSFITLHDAK